MSEPFVSHKYCISARDRYDQPGWMALLKGKLIDPATQIKHLDIWPKGWDAQSSGFIVDFLATNKHLRSVTIYAVSNDQNFDRTHSLVLATTTNPHLYLLKLHVNFKNADTYVLGEILNKSKSRLVELKLLQLGQLGSEGIGHLASPFCSLSRLKTLGLRNCAEKVVTTLFNTMADRQSPVRLNKVQIAPPRLAASCIAQVAHYLDAKNPTCFEELQLQGSQVQQEDMDVLLRCLSNHTIKSLSWRPTTVHPAALEFFSEFLEERSSVEKLSIGPLKYMHGGPPVYVHFEALCKNRSVTDLTLRGLGVESAVMVRELLRRNSFLRRFSCHIHVDLGNVRTLSEGIIFRNSTLNELELDLVDFDEDGIVDVAPLFEALISSAAIQSSGLVSLVLRAASGLLSGSVAAIAAALGSPRFRLKKLVIRAELRDVEVLEILTAASFSDTLSDFEIDGRCEWNAQTWSSFGAILPSLKLSSLHIECWEPTMDNQTVAAIQEELLRGVHANSYLEQANFVFASRPRSQSDQLDLPVKDHCARNIVAKGTTAMRTGTLPLSALPQALEALHEHCNGYTGGKKQHASLRASVLFAAVQSMQPGSESFQSMMEFFTSNADNAS